jgi:hypothetical protein
MKSPRLACRLVALVVIATCALASPALAQGNLLDDPGFDDPSLVSWPPGYIVQGSWLWDALDRSGSSASGSGRLENMYTGSTYTVTAGQCVNGVIAGLTFDAGVYVYFPTGQSATGYGWVQLVVYPGPDCTGNYIDVLNTLHVTQASPGVWHLSRLTLPTAPDGTASVRFVISNSKQSTGGSLVIHFDDAFLFLGDLFSDGFESGDTSAWSVTVP